MNPNNKQIALWGGVALLIVIGAVLLSFAFGGAEETAPVVDLNAISTNAALTVAAQRQTLEAGAATLAAASATPLPPLPSPTLQVAPPAILPTPAATLAANCDGATYASDVTIPDGTTIPAGQSFTKTWKVLNSGSCAWNPNYQLVFVGGDSLGGKATPIGLTVNPGAVADVSVVLTASFAQGTIEGKWRLANDKGVPFGDVLTVVINSVAAATATPTSPGVTEEPTFEFPTEETPTEIPAETPTGASP